jgi:hypothetical protein
MVAAEYNHVPLDGGDTLSPGSPPVSTVEEVQGIAYNSVTKSEVVTATKVVGEHSHPNIRPPGQIPGPPHFGR